MVGERRKAVNEDRKERKEDENTTHRRVEGTRTVILPMRLCLGCLQVEWTLSSLSLSLFGCVVCK